MFKNKSLNWGKFGLYMIGKISSYLTTGGNYLMRGADLCLSSRITWLVTGTLTSWNWGWMRAQAIQDSALHADDELSHTPDDCRTAQCDQQYDVRATGGWSKGCGDIVHNCHNQDCNQHFIIQNDNESKARHYAKRTHLFVHWDPIPLFQRCRPHAFDFGLAGAYLAFIVFGLCGGGRLPIQSTMLRYAAAQTAIKFLDVVVVSSLVIAKINPDPYGYGKAEDLGGVPSLKGYERGSPPALMLALAYFGLRISDGWLMAKMPVNTLPFASLARYLSVRF